MLWVCNGSELFGAVNRMAQTATPLSGYRAHQRLVPPFCFMSNDFIIQTQNLSKQFGDATAVHDISLSIPPGTILGFIGPSGCGKTTTMRLLLGIYDPTAGEATILGHAPLAFTQDDRERIGYMPQLFVLYPELSVRENLNFVASLYGVPLRRQERLRALLDLVELTGHERKLARNISGGMQRRLSLAAALVHDPELIFLDEPTAGIDPLLRRKLWDHFQQLKAEGRTLFVTTQYVGEAAYCDYVAVMHNGRLLMVETPTDLRRRALGGDVILIQPEHPLTLNQIDQLRQQAFVLANGLTVNRDNSLEVVVDDASSTLPILLNWIEDQGIAIQTAQEYNPPFDDIFVRLIEKETRNA